MFYFIGPQREKKTFCWLHYVLVSGNRNMYQKTMKLFYLNLYFTPIKIVNYQNTKGIIMKIRVIQLAGHIHIPQARKYYARVLFFLRFLNCRHFFDVGGIPLIFCALYSRELNIRESVILKRLRYVYSIILFSTTNYIAIADFYSPHYVFQTIVFFDLLSK